MIDRFKFRYFNKYANKMVKPENWQNVDGIYECIKQQVCFDEDIAPLPYDHIGNGLVFMQCTGLKDRNGTLIYEGDIVKDDKDLIYVVEFHEHEYTTSFSLKRIEIPNYYPHITTYCGLGYKNRNNFEVIGNIYENKELLEGAKE